MTSSFAQAGRVVSGATSPLLQVSNLRVSFPLAHGVAEVIRGVSLSIDGAQRVALVGESGSGKSVTALTILRLVRGSRAQGTILFDGVDLLSATPAYLRQIRGQRIGYIFQDSLSAFNPVRTIGEQVGELLRLRGMSRAEAWRRSNEALGRVGLPDPQRHMQEYPHQLSGGMRQRAMIAMALVAQPRLVIADEPTTALDVRLQARILALLRSLCEGSGTAVLLITHDLGIVAQFAERVVVMYAGQVMEAGSTDDLFHSPLHPYTRALLQSLPRVDEPRKPRLTTIEGYPPIPTEIPPGCPFHPRCPYAQEVCITSTPKLEKVAKGSLTGTTHQAACHFAEAFAEGAVEVAK